MPLTFKKDLINKLFQYKYTILIAFFSGLINSATTSLFGLLMGSFLHQSINNKITSIAFPVSSFSLENYVPQTLSLIQLGLLILFVLLIKNTFFIIYQHLLQKIRIQLIKKYRNQLYTQIILLDFHYFDQKNSAEIFTTVMNDVEAFNGLLLTFGRQFILNILIIINILIALCLVSLKLTVICFSISSFSLIFIYIISNYLKKKATNIRTVQAKILSHLQETLLGISVVKSFTKESYFIETFKKINQKYFNDDLKRTKVRILLSPIQEVTIIPGILLILFLAKKQIVIGNMSSESLLQFFTMLALLASPLRLAINQWVKFKETLPSIERIQKLWRPESRSTQIQKQLGNFESLEFKNLNYAYNNDEKEVLKKINLSIFKNEFIGIIGPSGSGKSTLIHLLLLFYKANKNELFFNKIPSEKVNKQEWNKKLAFIPQNPFLFSGTIEENLTLGANDISQDDLISACKQAQIWEEIKLIKNGLQYKIKEGGIGLSGGQKQRLCIARALLRKPEILLLDEATSQLDSKNDMHISKSIEKLKGKLTIIIISHKKENLQKADRILNLMDGQLKENI